MKLALGAQDLQRKSVADYYDSMYKGAVTEKTLREMQSLPESAEEALEAELAIIAAKNALTPYQTAQLKIDLLKLDKDERKLALDELKAYDVYINPDTNEAVAVPPGKAPPPGFPRRASTSVTNIGPYGSTLAREQARSFADLTGPEFSTNIIKDAQDILTADTWTELVEIASGGGFGANKDQQEQQARQQLVNTQVSIAEDKYSTLLTDEERASGWVVKWRPAFKFGGKTYPAGLYKVNYDTKEVDPNPLRRWKPKEF